MANIVRVLIIEDEPRSVDLFENFLSKEGLNKFILTHSTTLTDSLKELKSKKFDVILLDLVLPNGRGIEVFNKVFLECRGTPIVVTAHDEDKHTALEAVKAGAQDYLIKKDLTDQLLRRSLRYAIERKRLEVCRLEKELRLKRIVSSTKAAIYEIDFTTGRFTYVNDVMCEETGYTKEELLSMTADQILTKQGLDLWVKRYKEINSGNEIQPTAEFEILKKDGSHAWVIITAEYMRDENNKPTGANVIAIDITNKKKAETDAKKYHERLSLALQATSDGIWDWDDGDCYYSPRWETLLGYSPGTVENSLEGFLRLLHPDDVPIMKKNIETYMLGSKPVRNDYKAEFRMLCKDGKYKWILSKGKVIERHEDGLPKRIIGTHTDIDTRKRVELEMNAELEKHLDNWSEELKEFKQQQAEKIDTALEGFCDQHKRYGICKYE